MKHEPNEKKVSCPCTIHDLSMVVCVCGCLFGVDGGGLGLSFRRVSRCASWPFLDTLKKKKVSSALLTPLPSSFFNLRILGHGKPWFIHSCSDDIHQHDSWQKSRAKVAFTFEFWKSPSRPRGDDEWLRWSYVSQSQWTVLMMFLNFENKHRLSVAKENLTRGHIKNTFVFTHKWYFIPIRVAMSFCQTKN